MSEETNKIDKFLSSYLDVMYVFSNLNTVYRRSSHTERPSTSAGVCFRPSNLE